MRSKFLLLFLFLLLAGFSPAYSQFVVYSNTYHNEFDNNNFSTLWVTEPEVGYISAGTVFNPEKPEETAIRVLYVREDGAVIWDKIYKDASGDPSRCFNINNAPDGYILTGVSHDPNGSSIGLNRMLLVYINRDGDVIASNKFDAASEQSQGMHTVFTDDPRHGKGFLVCGYGVVNYNYVDDYRAYLLRVDMSLQPVWGKSYNTPAYFNWLYQVWVDYDMAEHVKEVPGTGFLVSGSDNGSYDGQQSAMLMLVDYDGNVIWNNSYESTNSREMTASLQVVGDLVYVLSNNSVIHSFAITSFNLGNGNLIRYQPFFCPDPNDIDYYGFELMRSPDNKYLAVAGMKRARNASSNSPAFLVEYDPGNNTLVSGRYFNLPSASYRAFGGYFEPFANYQQPLGLTPSMAAANEKGYNLVAYNDESGRISLEQFTTYPTEEYRCFEDELKFELPDRNYRNPAVIVTTGNVYHEHKIEMRAENHPVEMIRNCEPISPRLSSAATQSAGELVTTQLYPNPVATKGQVQIQVEQEQQTEIQLLDVVTGRTIRQVANGVLAPGTYTFEWDAEGLNNGLYLIRIKCGLQNQTYKVMVAH